MAELGRELVAGDGSAEHLQRVFARIGAALRFEILLHYQLLRPSRLTLVASTGLVEPLHERLREIDVGDSLCGAVALRRERLVLERLDEAPLELAAELRAAGIRCYVGVPLVAHGDLLGTLAFATGERRAVRTRELELIDAFGSQVASQLVRLRGERQLERATEALWAANRRKDQFLAILAHELRNPLAPIRTAVQTLKLVGSADPTIRRASEIIDRQATHLAALVDDLLDVARIGRGKLALKSEPIDLNAVVQHAVETCRPLLAAAQHELVVALREEPCMVTGDFRRLTQVVSNLLSNAAKYTAAGGRIEVSLGREGGKAVLRVRDNGRGMDAATLANVFDMFYQGTHDVERSGGGLGIGLALVKSLVALHHGEVEAFSEGSGRGSEFVVRLPCAGDAISTETAGAASASSRPAGVFRDVTSPTNDGEGPTGAT